MKKLIAILALTVFLAGFPGKAVVTAGERVRLEIQKPESSQNKDKPSKPKEPPRPKKPPKPKDPPKPKEPTKPK